MKLDKSYTIEKHAAKIMSLIEDKIGEGVFPSNEAIAEFWNAVSNPMPPRTFMYILKTTDDICYRSKGFSVLGLPDNWTFSWQDMMDICHVNQQKLITYQTLFLYEVFLLYPSEIRGKGIVYCTSRGVKNFNSTEGEYLLAHQIAYPVQYDESGYVTKYFCSYRIIGTYNGEALKSQVFADPKLPSTEEKLRELLEMSKSNMLGVLELTRREREILELFAYTEYNTAKKVAEKLSISFRTARRHINNVNRKAKMTFPLNNFTNIQNVIEYLKAQLILKK